ncbi:MAG: hypothetical protein WA974_13105 [Thermodesulfobacteriota bacterium]
MGCFPEYDQYDGLGLAELVRQGQITPMEGNKTILELVGSPKSDGRTNGLVMAALEGSPGC